MSKWTIKAWGKTKELIDTPYYSKHELMISAGSYCSLHYHQWRSNIFKVITGQVEIIEMYGPIIKKTMLGPDNTYNVPSLVPHMFVVYKNGLMIEEYYPDRSGAVSRDDIIRIIEGGKMSLDKLPNLPTSLF